MEEHAVGAAHTEVVTVDAMVLPVVVLAIVLVDRNLVEGCQVALIDAKLAVELVAGLDETIAEEGIDGFLCHADREGLEVHPAIGTLSIDDDGDIAAFAGHEKLAPCHGIHLHLAILTGCSKELLSPTLQLCNVGRGKRIAYDEVERRYVGRHNDTHVIGIDICTSASLGKLSGHLGLGLAAYNNK